MARPRRELRPRRPRRDRKPRRAGAPEPRLDELLDRLRVAELHRQRRYRPRAAEPVVDPPAQGRPLLEEDQRLAHHPPRPPPLPPPPPPARPRQRNHLATVERRHR